MKTIITLDRANQPYGYPQLDGSGSLHATGSLYGTASFAVSASWAPPSLLGGTQYSVPLWTGATTLGTSSLYESGSVLKSVYGGNDIGLKLDFANNIYYLGDNTTLSTTLYLDKANRNITIQAGTSSFLGGTTSIELNDQSQFMRTNDGIQGFVFDLGNYNYKLGRFSGGNTTEIIIDDPTNTISISGSLLINTGSLNINVVQKLIDLEADIIAFAVAL